MADSESNNYVSRGALKIDSASKTFKVNYLNKKVLDIGSSTGGFTDYALQHGAEKVIAIELGSKQMVDALAKDPRVELHEKTDILDVSAFNSKKDALKLSFNPDIVVVDLSFVSLKKILPHVSSLVSKNTKLVVLVKPQFESGNKDKVKGIVKNEAIRRRILKDFELWVKSYFVILDKVDSKVVGTFGNKERFYYLTRKINS